MLTSWVSKIMKNRKRHFVLILVAVKRNSLELLEGNLITKLAAKLIIGATCHVLVEHATSLMKDVSSNPTRSTWSLAFLLPINNFLKNYLAN